MSRNFTRQPDESTLTTLCPHCLSAFRNARGIRVRRADPYQLTKEPCTYCQTRFGYDYYIQPTSPKATYLKPPILRKAGSMMKLTALKIDPEFQGKIPPLTSEELDQLEKNIVSDGKVINPIIVWNGLIIDGHNRYAILQKHPDIPYTVHEKEFADRYEAIVWICKNQLGRRNLTVEQKNYLIGKQYEAEKQSDFNRGNQYTSSKKSGCYQNGNSQKASRTCERIASENGIARNTVIRAEKFAKGVDAAEEAVPGTRQKVLSGEVKPTAAEIASVARAPPEDRPALVEKICKPKEPKKSGSKSTAKLKKVEKSTTSTAPCEVQAEPPVIEVPTEPIIQPKQKQTALQTIRTLSTKMESVEQVADAEGMLSEVSSAADSMIYRLDVCFEHYPEFLKNPKIRQKVVGLLQKAKDYIVKLEGEFAYD